MPNFWFAEMPKAMSHIEYVYIATSYQLNTLSLSLSRLGGSEADPAVGTTQPDGIGIKHLVPQLCWALLVCFFILFSIFHFVVISPLDIPPGVLNEIVNGLSALAKENLDASSEFKTLKDIISQIAQIYGSNSATVGNL